MYCHFLTASLVVHLTDAPRDPFRGRVPGRKILPPRRPVLPEKIVPLVPSQRFLPSACPLTRRQLHNSKPAS